MGGFLMCALCLVLLTLNVAGSQVLKNIRMVQTVISAEGSVEQAVGDSSSMRNPEAEVAISGAALRDLTRRASRTSQDGGSLDKTVIRKAQQYNMKWGGAARLSNDQTSWMHTMLRPEAVHSEACDPSSKICSVCDSKTACWHGVGTEGANAFEIIVPSGIAPKDYAFSVWTNCKDGGGNFNLVVQHLEHNTELTVYVNGKLARSITTDTRRRSEGIEITKAQMGNDAQIKIVASRRNAKDHAGFSASVSMSANVPRWVDTCMDRNFCLKGLGDGTAAAFELRNNNRRQYECLQGNAASHLKRECDKWRSCFAGQTGTNHEAEVRKVLSAVFEKKKNTVAPTTTKTNKKKNRTTAKNHRFKKNRRFTNRNKKTSLGEKEATSMQELLGASSSSKIDDVPGCTDPAAADVEALECECLDQVRDNCAANDVTDLEECFLTYMCEHAVVCASWKEGHCPGGGSLLMQRSSVNSASPATLDQEKKVLANRSARGASTPSRDDLDGALSGKCSQ